MVYTLTATWRPPTGGYTEHATALIGEHPDWQYVQTRALLQLLRYWGQPIQLSKVEWTCRLTEVL